MSRPGFDGVLEALARGDALPAMARPKRYPEELIATRLAIGAGVTWYTIQIDDSQSFSAPLTVGQTLTFSQLTTSSLPTRRMWWRVRANDGAGVAGAWSSARRLELKN